MASPFRALLFSCALALPPLEAFALGFVVDPAASTISVVAPSQLQVGFPPLLTPVPLVAPTPGGGVGGFVLPDASTSDGLTTFVQGTIEGDYVPGTSFEFLAGSALVLGDSGTWLAGLPGTPGTPAAANLGVHFEDAGLGLTGDAALRGATAAILGAGPSVLTPQGGGVFTFSGADLYTLAGTFAYLSLGFSGSDPFFGFASMPGPATVEELPGVLRLTLPLAMTIVLDDSNFPGGLPIEELELHLVGEIVALATVPEPGGAALLAAGLGLLLGLAGAQRRGPLRGRASGSGGRLLLAGFVLVAPLAGCPDSRPTRTFVAADGEDIQDVSKLPGPADVRVTHTDPPFLGGGNSTSTAQVLSGPPSEGSLVNHVSPLAVTDVFLRDFGVNDQTRVEIGVTSILNEGTLSGTTSVDVDLSTEQVYQFVANTGGAEVTVSASQTRLGPAGPGSGQLDVDVLALCRGFSTGSTTTGSPVVVFDGSGVSSTPLPAPLQVLRFNVGPPGVTSTAACTLDVDLDAGASGLAGTYLQSLNLEIVEVASAEPTPGSNPPQGLIFSSFDPFLQTTFYFASVSDPDGGSIEFDWSGPDCGTFGEDPLDPAQFFWEHPHPPCDPTQTHDHVRVVVTVTDDDGWQVECAIQGASSQSAECKVVGVP